MARSLRLLAAAAALLGMAAFAAAAARPQPTVEPAALANGALACRGVPDDFAAAERRIVELGWPRALHNERGGGSSGSEMPLFERDGLILLLYPPDGEGHPMACAVIAPLRRSVRRADLAAALSAALGRQPGPDTAGGFPVWVLDGGQVMDMTYADGGDGTVLLNFWYPRTAPR
jgi:hypothetical protein